MIVYVVTRPHRYTMDSFLYNWGHEIRRHVAVIEYELLPFLARLPAATYVFSDLERLAPATQVMAASVCDQLGRAGLHVLNHPRSSLRRYGLLTAMHESGRNTFRAARLGEHGDLRLPVFIRDENEHRGNLSKLIRRREDIDRAAVQLRRAGVKLDSTLVVEFCDTSDPDGVFRKYSAFNVGGIIIPRHLMHGRKWSLKKADIINEETTREENAYLSANPHRKVLREVFRTAGLGYGRIDYALLDDKVQVWEINTNPMLLEAPSVYSEVRLPAQKNFAKLIGETFSRMAKVGGSGVPVPIRVDPEEGEAALVEMAEMAAYNEKRSGLKRRRRKPGAGTRR